MSARNVEIAQPYGPHSEFVVTVDGVRWCTVETIHVTRRNSHGPDWAATRSRAQVIANALRGRASTDGETP